MSQPMKYKGYYGSIEASTEDDCLFGKLMYIDALVNYEAHTVAALRKSFEDAVDDYLADCAQVGKEPSLPFKGVFNIRTGPQRHERVAMAVRKHKMKSLNEFVNQAIDRELERLG